MNTFISRTAEGGFGLRLAVKDCIDVTGLPTTCGSPALSRFARPAAVDATCLAGARADGARIVGKTNLSELCHSGTGVNEYFGTPVNPLDAKRVPGGSSSGSAVAVAEGTADVAIGTDTTGSVRIPAAACGVAGLIMTRALVPTGGIHPMAPSLDTVGVLAPNLEQLHHVASLLIPNGVPAPEAEAHLVLRLRLEGGVIPTFDSAVDRALAAAELRTRDLRLPRWRHVTALANRLAAAEAYRAQKHVLAHGGPIGREVRATFAAGREVRDDDLRLLRCALDAWRRRLTSLLRPGVLLAFPTLLDRPPLLGTGASLAHPNAPINAAGLPAVTVPTGYVPFASIQFAGGPFSEGTLLATARRVMQR